MTEEIAARFARDAAEHQMTVLHDDGLYRHLQFRNPRHSMYWFDLITVPGALIFWGDGDSFVFSRITDMFEFFRGPAGQINPQYWAEKVTSGHDGIRRYCQELLALHVTEYVDETVDDGDGGTLPEYAGLSDAIRERILDELMGDASIDRKVVEDFRWWADPDDEHAWPSKEPDFQFSDVWEWDMQDYHWWFLWACHGIVWGIAEYDKGRNRPTAEAPATDDAAPQPATKPTRRRQPAKLTRQPAKRSRKRIDSEAKPGTALTHATHLDGRPVADVHLPDLEAVSTDA